MKPALTLQSMGKVSNQTTLVITVAAYCVSKHLWTPPLRESAMVAQP